MLIEAAKADGLFASVGVGHGKTLVTLALPEAMEARKALLIVPAKLKKKTLREISELYGKHFHLPTDRLTIMSSSEISLAKNTDYLEKNEFDLIVR